MEEKAQENNFIVGDEASERIAYLISMEEDKTSKLRISVEGGGCSGFQYKYEITNLEAFEDDLIFKKDNAIIVIDSISLGFLNGARLDYIKNLGGEYFEIKNPNAASGCGCGNSFSI
jgi:iron-sulfur cluster assembly accessory protein